MFLKMSIYHKSNISIKITGRTISCINYQTVITIIFTTQPHQLIQNFADSQFLFQLFARTSESALETGTSFHLQRQIQVGV